MIFICTPSANAQWKSDPSGKIKIYDYSAKNGYVIDFAALDNFLFSKSRPILEFDSCKTSNALIMSEDKPKGMIEFEGQIVKITIYSNEENDFLEAITLENKIKNPESDPLVDIQMYVRDDLLGAPYKYGLCIELTFDNADSPIDIDFENPSKLIVNYYKSEKALMAFEEMMNRSYTLEEAMAISELGKGSPGYLERRGAQILDKWLKPIWGHLKGSSVKWWEEFKEKDLEAKPIFLVETAGDLAKEMIVGTVEGIPELGKNIGVCGYNMIKFGFFDEEGNFSPLNPQNSELSAQYATDGLMNTLLFWMTVDGTAVALKGAGKIATTTGRNFLNAADNFASRIMPPPAVAVATNGGGMRIWAGAVSGDNVIILGGIPEGSFSAIKSGTSKAVAATNLKKISENHSAGSADDLAPVPQKVKTVPQSTDRIVIGEKSPSWKIWEKLSNPFDVLDDQLINTPVNIKLNDGRIIKGKFTSKAEEYITLRAQDGAKYKIFRNSISSLDLQFATGEMIPGSLVEFGIKGQIRKGFYMEETAKAVKIKMDGQVVIFPKESLDLYYTSMLAPAFEPGQWVYIVKTKGFVQKAQIVNANKDFVTVAAYDIAEGVHFTKRFSRSELLEINEAYSKTFREAYYADRFVENTSAPFGDVDFTNSELAKNAATRAEDAVFELPQISPEERINFLARKGIKAREVSMQTELDDWIAEGHKWSQESYDKALSAGERFFARPRDGYIPNGIFYNYVWDKIGQQGWKIHVAATKAYAQEIADMVLPRLRQMGVNHKVLKNIDALDTMAESSLGTQAGKFITIYPSNSAHAIEIARVLEDILKTKRYLNAPPIVGEMAIGDTGLLFTRYGEFAGNGWGLKNPFTGEIEADIRGKFGPEWAIENCPFTKANYKETFID